MCIRDSLYIAGHDTAGYEADFTWTFDEASFEQVNIHTNPVSYTHLYVIHRELKNLPY